MAPVSPAASANGTVRPSAIPMTMSRTTSLDVKCRSMWGVCGIDLEFSHEHENADDDKCHGRATLYPLEWDVVANHATHNHAERRNRGERKTRADEHSP